MRSRELAAYGSPERFQSRRKDAKLISPEETLERVRDGSISVVELQKVGVLDYSTVRMLKELKRQKPHAPLAVNVRNVADSQLYPLRGVQQFFSSLECVDYVVGNDSAEHAVSF